MKKFKKLYVNNLFDEDYENSRGYAMTDQTYGAAINFGFYEQRYGYPMPGIHGGISASWSF